MQQALASHPGKLSRRVREMVPAVAFNQFTKDIGFLGKLRILPEIVFIMIFKNECNVMPLGIRQTLLNAFGRQLDPFLYR